MSLWATVVGFTSQSPGRLWGFGLTTMAVTGVLGTVFASMTASPQSLKDQQRSIKDMPLDAQRTANAQQDRLKHMIKDVVAGDGDSHWSATMRGTLVPHPNQENKTIGAENEHMAREASRRR